MEFNHKHLLLRAEVTNPPMTVDAMNEWLLATVRAADMKVLAGPFSVVCETIGNTGVTGAVVIEFSHCSCHSFSEGERPFVQLDLYSCKDFDEKSILVVLNEYFGVVSFKNMLVDRNCLDDGPMMVIPSALVRLSAVYDRSANN